MKFSKIFNSTVAIALLAGCASVTVSQRDQYLKNEYFAEAYQYHIHTIKDATVADRKSVAEIISSKTSDKKDKFYIQMKSLVEEANYYYIGKFAEFKDTIDFALEDKLISNNQHKLLISSLKERVVVGALSRPSILEDSLIISKFPGIESEKNRIFFERYKKLEGDKNPEITEYLKIIDKLSSAGETEKVLEIKESLKRKVKEKIDIAKNGFEKDDDLRSILIYVNNTNNREFDNEVQEAIKKTNLSKLEFQSKIIKNLPEEYLNKKAEIKVGNVYPELVDQELKRRLLPINFVVNGDEFAFGEVLDEIEKINQWIVQDSEASNKIVFDRFRFQENKGQIQSATETVSDLNFGVLLVIPKNASVLFDYTKSDYSVQWTMNIVGNKLKSRKNNIAGRQQASKIECRNVRYQNVYGGTGSLSFYPNDRVANFCEQTKNVNFDNIRDMAIKKIANEAVNIIVGDK